MSFNSFNLSSTLQQAIERSGFVQPTPIQQQAIPVVLEGHDVVGLAQTGTGKTAAFVLPMLERLAAGPRKRGVRALIVAPTRELAEQISEVVKTYSKPLGFFSTVIYGGASFGNQKRILDKGVQIVIACPGRLLDHVRQRTINLKEIEVLVLDEADQMFDMGFLPNIRAIVREIPKQRQTLLFSATMPKEIRVLADDILTDPKTVSVGISRPAETIDHCVVAVDQGQKSKVLIELLKGANGGSVLVFTRTKHQAKRIGNDIGKYGFKATSLQGNLSQNRRKEALEGFRGGKYQVMVATDIAARGLDISGIVRVINFDIPSTPEAYTHRIGRTGRAEQTGEAFTLVGAEDRGLLRQIERTLSAPIERKLVEGYEVGFDLASVPAGSEARSGRNQNQRRSQNNGQGNSRRNGQGGGQRDGQRSRPRNGQGRSGSSRRDSQGDSRPSFRSEGSRDENRRESSSEPRSEQRPNRDRRAEGQKPFRIGSNDRPNRNSPPRVNQASTETVQA